MIRGVPLFVYRWDPMKGLTKLVHDTCPLWVKLHNIPLVAFNREGISRISSALGVPKHMDACTSSMCDKAWGRPGFAKVLVEVWAVGELKRELEVVVPSLSGGEDANVMVKVEYLWEPVQCSHCLVFGHKTSTCIKADLVKKSKPKGPSIDTDGFTRVERRQWKPKNTGGDTLSGVDKETAAGRSEIGDKMVTQQPKGAQHTNGSCDETRVVGKDSSVPHDNSNKVNIGNVDKEASQKEILFATDERRDGGSNETNSVDLETPIIKFKTTKKGERGIFKTTNRFSSLAKEGGMHSEGKKKSVVIKGGEIQSESLEEMGSSPHSLDD